MCDRQSHTPRFHTCGDRLVAEAPPDPEVKRLSTRWMSRSILRPEERAGKIEQVCGGSEKASRASDIRPIPTALPPTAIRGKSMTDLHRHSMNACSPGREKTL
jgi:hypothetical protein